MTDQPSPLAAGVFPWGDPIDIAFAHVDGEGFAQGAAQMAYQHLRDAGFAHRELEVPVEVDRSRIQQGSRAEVALALYIASTHALERFLVLQAALANSANLASQKRFDRAISGWAGALANIGILQSLFLMMAPGSVADAAAVGQQVLSQRQIASQKHAEIREKERQRWIPLAEEAMAALRARGRDVTAEAIRTAMFDLTAQISPRPTIPSSQTIRRRLLKQS